MGLKLDHIVVSAETLEDGRRYVENCLGVPLQTGGKHALMGTHNLLLGLEGGVYLEVIAIDPDAPDPGRPRWFGLDSFSGEPKLTNWVGRSDSIARDMQIAFGAGTTPTALSRGDLNWQMSVIDQPQTPFDGLVPMMLDWGDGPTASDRLGASGVRLKRLDLAHPDRGGLVAALEGLVEEPLVKVVAGDTPAIAAVFETPKGEVVLR